MIRPVEARINLRALQHNLALVRSMAPSSHCMAVIKANGYGHGMVRVARALAKADGFGVASFEEALELRDAGITQPITLLSGFLESAELPLIARHALTVTVHHRFQVEMLERTRLETPLRVWLKIDTGMHRLGVSLDEVRSLWERLSALPWVQQPIGLLTHFACADDRDNVFTAEQMQRFDAVTAGLPGARSLANSAGTMAWPQARRDWVRPGVALYGASPFTTLSAQELGLQAVMTLKSRLISIRRVQRGERIGYGAAWTCPEDMSIGIVAMGYGDGYPRHAQAGTPVWVGSRRVPLVGRVSMDSLYVDLRQHPGAKIGDSVILWGDELPVEAVAATSGTIPYELLCKVTGRVKFNEIA